VSLAACARLLGSSTLQQAGINGEPVEVRFHHLDQPSSARSNFMIHWR